MKMVNVSIASAVMAFACAVSVCNGANDWENQFVNEINREQAVVASMPQKVMSLNGIWKMKWCGKPDQRTVGFYEKSFDDSCWHEIDVPSCVEMRGWGVPIYTNFRYPHPGKPPFTDKNYNPVTSYRKRFVLPESWNADEVFVRFNGVASAYYLWVNGKKVGYSEDSRLPGIFDITPYLTGGENVMAVEVYRWSDGSYLEDQDMFRFSGIFRDVNLFAVPKIELNNFNIETKLVNDYRDVILSIDLRARAFDKSRLGDAKASGILYDADGREVCRLNGVLSLKNEKEFAGLVLETEVKSPRLWNAEDPYLYKLVITVESADGAKDVREAAVGFRCVEVKGKKICINGKPIMIKGVNRHDCHPENGWTVSHEDMEKDVLLMKRHNINAVRTSHYPNDPYWYELCDKYGIYLIAEANVECHGDRYIEGITRLAWDPNWKHVFIERNENQVRNFRNHPSIIIWSFGNECGVGAPVFPEVNKAVKALDKTRLTHYCANTEQIFDIVSSMYREKDWLDERINGLEMPFILCEYAHAMGNGLGTFTEYWDYFYSHDVMAGGCVWDWADQAVWKNTDRIGADGKKVRILSYGGDHDEEPHDGPFCCNGVVDPFRNVSAKLEEVKHVHRNIVVKREGMPRGKAQIWNRFAFTPLSKFDAKWILLRDGVCVADGKLSVGELMPGEKKMIDLPKVKTDETGEYLMTVSFVLKSDESWAKAGYVIAHDQFAYVPHENVWDSGDKKSVGKLDVNEDDGVIRVKGENVEVEFSRMTGTLSKLVMAGKEILRDREGVVFGPQVAVQRAFTDNDGWLKDGAHWQKPFNGVSFIGSGLTQLRYHPVKMSAKTLEGGSVEVVTEVLVTGAKSAGFNHESRWVISSDGEICVKNIVTPFGRMPHALFRMGTAWKLDKSLEQMKWYGRGPWENYADRKNAADVGIWKSTVTDQYVSYVRPQDNGAKCDVRWVEFADEDGRGVRFTCSLPMYVQALHYGVEDLEFARHRLNSTRYASPLIARDEVCLNIDIRQLGLGGGSCGPRPYEKYVFPIQREEWEVRLQPIRTAHK